MANKITCIIVDDEPTAREVVAAHLKRINHMEVLGSCESAGEAFGLINAHQVDLIFLDINMPEISGLSFARSINPEIKVIFTTAYREYAVDGFDLQAVDYLLKPISFERLLRAVNAYSNIHFNKGELQFSRENEEQQDFMFVRADRKMIRINFEDIFYIESLSDYLKIHTRTGSIMIRETMSNIEKELPVPKFIRIHRSFIVSLAALNTYTNEHLEVAGKTLPISRSYKSTVLATLEKWALE
ncbi:MAG TPA: LytTR family DNA-binding domain-containing protein [Gillisia sp.]|nr:LytTR family DNA-binding domain-containing protein [Gillisia sp.]